VQQPPGLTVPLRLHQQQSLHRLLEAERLPLGYNSWLWCRVPTPGEPVWLSLVLGKMSREAPSKAPCGGFLGEGGRGVGGGGDQGGRLLRAVPGAAWVGKAVYWHVLGPLVHGSTHACNRCACIASQSCQQTRNLVL
jgi:hypothetical protein